MSETVAREVEETVTAALSDPDAARALAAGRLATALSPGANWFAGAGAGAGAGTAPRPAADIVKARDVGDGAYVVVEQQKLADIAPGRSRSIDITTFVDLDEIDPVFFQKTYWLAPTEEQYGHAYGLLRHALAKTNRASIATFVMRGQEYLTAVRADDKLLALETLYFADEIRDPEAQFPSLPDSGPGRGKELDMATMLIESMAGPWEPEEYHDTYTER